jgi:hypothetical protein
MNESFTFRKQAAKARDANRVGWSTVSVHHRPEAQELSMLAKKEIEAAFKSQREWEMSIEELNEFVNIVSSYDLNIQ